DGRHRAFAVAAGGAVCGDCRPGGASVPATASLDLMRALESGDWASATAADPRQRGEAAGLIAAHFQWHSERPLRTLKYVPH
ncbi:DNA repair protein RecO C-terminal domain-containing protein, partial [Glycomyces dulcitolivorans]|uniref:DNA repair protein RecO C-terminal domain-containing protein n=1 Tax=Glycomyces dulcitolivorans TaxID=2200759 RepID=UPI001E50974C